MMRSTALIVVALTACAHTVPQDKATGPDGKLNGARPMVFDNDEAKVKGIVTYPGGDRVDWRSLEIPTGKKGTLELEMKYVTPRPGLRLAFDVFDQYRSPIASAAKGKGRIRSTQVPVTAGKYYVRVYAPRRGDAGQYILKAAFTPSHDLPAPDILKLPIPDPPKLPDATADEPVTPPTPPVVATPTPTPPVVTTPTPPPTPVAEPVIARVLKVDVESNGVFIRVSVGSENGIGKTWKAQMLRGDTSAPLPGGAATIIRVDKRVTTMLVHLTTDQIGANPNVKLSP